MKVKPDLLRLITALQMQDTCTSTCQCKIARETTDKLTWAEHCQWNLQVSHLFVKVIGGLTQKTIKIM